MITKEETEKKEETKKPTKKWNSSWRYGGPLHIPEELKDPRFEYGWVNFREPGRLSSVLAQGGQIDTEIGKKRGVDYTISNQKYGAPLSGAYCIGDSMLIRYPKEIAHANYLAEQESVIEPERVAESNLQVSLGIPNSVVGEGVASTRVQ